MLALLAVTGASAAVTANLLLSLVEVIHPTPPEISVSAGLETTMLAVISGQEESAVCKGVAVALASGLMGSLAIAVKPMLVTAGVAVVVLPALSAIGCTPVYITS